MSDAQRPTRSYPFPPDGRLRIDMVHGSLAIQAVDDDGCIVTAGHRGSRDRTTGDRFVDGLIRVEPRADGVSIAVRGRPQDGMGLLFGGASPVVDMLVQVPRSARVTISSVGADVTTTGLVVQQSIRTLTGLVVVDLAAGDVDVATVSGRIKITGDLMHLTVSTTSGTVSVQAVRIDDARLESVNGDIYVTGRLAGDLEHRIGTTSGNLTLRSEGGLRVSMRSVSGRFRSDLALQREDTAGQHVLIVGDGTARLRFRTVSGDLKIRGPVGEGLPMPADPAWSEMLALLDALERGEIDVDEATRRLEVTHG